ncbi:MAG: sulfatase-like hydrolase/transferase, partial [Clostridia bacterium]
VFILTDDQRYNTIAALGNTQIKTPNMDRLVHSGTSFTHAHIPGGTSGAVCMPSRAMLNTGRTLLHLEGEGQTIPTEHTTMGEMFKENGYHCFGTGKWHNSPQAYARSFSDGENIFFGGMWDHWNVPMCFYDPTGEFDNVIDFVCDYSLNRKTTKVHCDKFNPGKHSSEVLTETSVNAIKSMPKDKPFFLYTAYLAPHDPRTMPEKFKNMYKPEDIVLPDNYMTEHPFDFGVFNIRDEKLAAYPRVEGEVREHLAEYFGMITHLDHEIGKIISALEETGELENTIIVLAGDNGLGLGSHALFGKQNHYDHSIRVPLIFSGKGIPQGEIRDNYVYLLDIFPTLCDLLGYKIPSSVEGKSFAKSFEDATYKTRKDLFFVYNDLLRSVKDEQYKLIEYRPSKEYNTSLVRTQLFDLKNDPSEINDLYGKEEYKEVVNKLRERLQEYRKEWGDDNHRYGQQFWANY